MEKGEILLSYDYGNTEDGAIRCDKRQEDAEGGVKSGRTFLHYDFEHLHEYRYDKDEGYGLDISETERFEDIMLEHPCDSRGDCHDEGDSHAHAESGIKIFRYADEWADAEKLCEYDVVDEYRRNYYSEIFKHGGYS